MSNYKEFTGKSLDEAIENACDYYNLKRDKLEIEILTGGSSGIFGLVGAKKASIKARPRPEMGRLESDGTIPADEALPEDTQAEKEMAEREEPKRPSGNRRSGRREQPRAEHKQPSPSSPEPGNEIQAEAPDQAEADAPAPAESEAPADQAPEREPEPAVDRAELEAAVREVLDRLIEPMAPKPKLEMIMESGRLDVFIDDDEHSGLIIGREGATLSALQYLVNRMVSKKLGAPVRVQLDAGDYREKQNEKLRRIALQLADKAKHGGRVQSTKPLSSYHRRVVHLALQGDDAVQTRSKGDGPLKRVLILPKKRGGSRPQRSNYNY